MNEWLGFLNHHMQAVSGQSKKMYGKYIACIVHCFDFLHVVQGCNVSLESVDLAEAVWSQVLLWDIMKDIYS